MNVECVDLWVLLKIAFFLVCFKNDIECSSGGKKWIGYCLDFPPFIFNLMNHSQHTFFPLDYPLDKIHQINKFLLQLNALIHREIPVPACNRLGQNIQCADNVAKHTRTRHDHRAVSPGF